MQMPLVLSNRRRRGGSASAPAFSPSSLYSSGSQGIWLDPSDLSTMFSDRAGTTPVTTPGTVVGLRLDKSKGLALKAELVLNGTFDANITNWTSGSSAVLSWDSGGRLSVQNTTISSNRRAYQAFSTIIGATYQVSGTIIGADSGRINIGTSAVATEIYTSAALAAGSYTYFFTATATTSFIGLATATGLTTVLFDNISVRELPGNHATAPTDAARPTYGVEPKGGRRNLLTWSEDFGNAVWAKNGSTAPGTQYLAPDGTTTAEALVESATTASHYVTRADQVTTAVGTFMTLSVYAKPASGVRYLQIYPKSVPSGTAFARFNLQAVTSAVSGSGATASITDAGGGWYRCVLNITVAAGNTNLDLFFGLADDFSDVIQTSYTGDGTSGIYLWGAQLELGSTATPYQRVLSAYDITESGVATTHYVQYDGSDDSMSTAAIDFTATDKMSVFAGIRSLNDAVQQEVVGTFTGANAGSFSVVAPNNSTSPGNFGFYSRGSVAVATVALSNTYTAPISAVLTGIGDISGDLSSIRTDGIVGTNVTADQGTGNYGNFAMFIGRRNNATLPFNGKDYGIIIVGKAASAGEITDTETWLAAKTSGVTI